ncbi:MAG TPA: hypothetical protein VJ001_05530, partial [Rhodocyclaceae bacterium]|nr:hypothetical protein [Rhodocyclaceae bacterium]
MSLNKTLQELKELEHRRLNNSIAAESATAASIAAQLAVEAEALAHAGDEERARQAAEEREILAKAALEAAQRRQQAELLATEHANRRAEAEAAA